MLHVVILSVVALKRHPNFCWWLLQGILTEGKDLVQLVSPIDT
jgi:hypothetical protein